MYHSFGAQLADRGFIVYAPQNPYVGGETYRSLQRKANPVKQSLTGIAVGQHQQLLTWLAGLSIVDSNRIAFYGLSYGGHAAMRIPALLDEYALSISSGNFTDWLREVSDTSFYTYLFDPVNYDMLEFNLGHTVNYAEMAGLIAPRPCMVERGHHDGVAPDEHVAYEYAQVRRLYVDLGIPERTEIEYFDGPHEIHGVGTFRFLHRELNWPEQAD